MNHSSLTLAVFSTVFGAAALLASSALAVDVKLYGNVDKAFMLTDDGRSTDSTVVDNNNNPTRFGLAGEHKLDNGLTASLLLEAGVNSNGSNVLQQNTTVGQSNTPAGTGTASFHERYARVGLASDKWGALFLGNQNIADDDSLGHDLTAVNELMNGAAISTFGANYYFQRSNTAGTGVTLGGTLLTPGAMSLNQDGSTAFAQSVRYNTPTWHDLNGSVSYDQGGNVDIAARMASYKLGMVTLDGGLGYTFNNGSATTATDINRGTFAGSLSGKLDNGLGATVGYIQTNLDNKSAGVSDPSGWYAKVGYNWGAYGIAADYARFDHSIASATANSMNTFGLGADYDLGHGVVLGALFRQYSLDVSSIATEDIRVGIVNLQVAF